MPPGGPLPSVDVICEQAPGLEGRTTGQDRRLPIVKKVGSGFLEHAWPPHAKVFAVLDVL
jgi:hypothetical protein